MIVKKKKRKHMFNDDSILPLINIIFLLIIFFMVLGHIYPNAVKKADLAQLPASTNYIKQDITLYMNPQGVLYQDGEQITLKSIPYSKKMVISLVVDKTTPAIIFVKSLNDFKKIGADKVSIVVKKDIKHDF